MARIYYDQCEISINNTGILAVSANINSEITLGPLYFHALRYFFSS